MPPVVFLLPLALATLAGYSWFRSRKKIVAAREKADADRKKVAATNKAEKDPEAAMQSLASLSKEA